MIFHITLDNKSSRFLSDLKTWTVAEDRGFTDDGAGHAEATKMTKEAKAALLNIILGSISSYAPIISPRFIKQQSTSLESIWDRLRSYYGLRKTGARILEFSEIKLEQNESREALWERLTSFLEDNLLSKNGGVKHVGVKPEENEAITPTLSNILVSKWLECINPALPLIVRQRFSAELRNNTVYSIREEISDSIPTLIAEMEEREGVISRAAGFQRGNRNKNKPSSSDKRSCCLCETAGRSSTNHFLSACPFLPASDKKYWSNFSRTRNMTVEEELGLEEVNSDDVSKPLNRHIASPSSSSEASIRRVDIRSSPVLKFKVNCSPTTITLDSGSEVDIIAEDECNELGVKILRSSQRARLANGETQLEIVGEAHFIAVWGHHKLKFGGLVAKTLDSPILAGMPFLEQNDISIRYSSKTVYFGDCCSVKYQATKKALDSGSIKLVSPVSVLRISNQTCVLPGEEVSFQLPKEFEKEDLVAVEPRTTVPLDMPSWMKCEVLPPSHDGCVKIRNTSSDPVLLSKHSQACQVRPINEVDLNEKISRPSEDISLSAPSSKTLKSDSSNLSVITVQWIHQTHCPKLINLDSTNCTRSMSQYLVLEWAVIMVILESSHMS